MTRILKLVILLAFTSVGLTFAAPPGAFLGPVEEGAILDDFAGSSKAVWNITAGTNTRYQFDTGRNIPGVASSLAQIELSTKDAQDRVGGHNWYSMKRVLDAGSVSHEANGIR